MSSFVDAVQLHLSPHYRALRDEASTEDSPFSLDSIFGRVTQFNYSIGHNQKHLGGVQEPDRSETIKRDADFLLEESLLVVMLQSD